MEYRNTFKISKYKLDYFNRLLEIDNMEELDELDWIEWDLRIDDKKNICAVEFENNIRVEVSLFSGGDGYWLESELYQNGDLLSFEDGETIIEGEWLSIDEEGNEYYLDIIVED